MSPADRFAAARTVIASGLSARAFPAAAVEIGGLAGPIWSEAFGHLTYDVGAPPCRTDTIFDLASLTKVIATASIAMHLIEVGRLRQDLPIAEVLPEWGSAGRATIEVRHLLDHSSGLPAHARLWEQVHGREAYRRAIAVLPLERAPGSASVYSDPGFMVLGFLLEEVGGASLDTHFRALGLIGSGPLLYRPDADLRSRSAPTEDDPWRARVLRGEVHDENAAALNGVAAHAGLFGTAAAVGAFARLVLQTFQSVTPLGSPDLMRLFASRTGVPDSSRALAWDTMLPTSSCGTRLSASAIGHTGYTGTSLWIDRERDLYVVLLTNRVHPTRKNEQLAAIRPKFHDAVVAALAST